MSDLADAEKAALQLYSVGKVRKVVDDNGISYWCDVDHDLKAIFGTVMSITEYDIMMPVEITL